jgi:uncharacterized delta-60 repeat protein
MGRALVCLILSLCASALGVPATSAAAPADLDRSFGENGIVEIPGADSFVPGEAGGRMAIGPHDEIFVLYSNYPPCDPPFNCTVGLTVARYTADGRLDPGFAAGPQLTVKQSPMQDDFALAVGPDGKPVIAAYGGEGGLVVARLGLDGRLDPSFGSGGIAVAPEKLITVTRDVPKAVIQPDGKVLVAVQGGFEDEGTSSRGLLVVRFLANGHLDPGFGEGGEARPQLPTQTRPAGVFLGANGAITIPAPLCCLGGTPLYGEGFSVVRLATNGQPDPAWAGDGSLFFPTPGVQGAVEAAAPTPDGGLFVSYEGEGSTVSTVGNVIKLTSNGELDSGFGSGGGLHLYERVGSISPSGLAVDPEGRVLGVGWSDRMVVFRLRSNGGRDRTFNGGERVSLPFGGGGTTEYMVGVQSSGRIIAFGDSGLGAVKQFGLIALRGGTDHSRCLGKKATIVGTAGPDKLTGTPHRDVIAALGGADEVRALSGPDLICGGKGKDRLFGGPGRDEVRQDPRRSH